MRLGNLQDPSALRELAIKRVEDEEASKGATEDRMLPPSGMQKMFAVTMALGTVQNAFLRGFQAQVFSDGESCGTGKARLPVP